VAGPIPAARLGHTLMHEHLAVGFPGWWTDYLGAGPAFRDLVFKCVDRIEELKSAGFSSLLDPCPSDMGRDVDLMGEVAARTGFNIIFATGLCFWPAARSSGAPRRALRCWTLSSASALPMSTPIDI